jgi:hypothetical protein
MKIARRRAADAQELVASGLDAGCSLAFEVARQEGRKAERQEFKGRTSEGRNSREKVGREEFKGEGRKAGRNCGGAASPQVVPAVLIACYLRFLPHASARRSLPSCFLS